MSDVASADRPGMKMARYRRRFMIDGVECEVVITARTTGLESVLLIGGDVAAADSTPATGSEAVRNHHLRARMADGSEIEVEAGYISWLSVGIAVRRNGHLVHESHSGRRIAYPERAKRMVLGSSGPGLPPAYDPGAFSRNKVPLAVDIALGALFYVVAKLTDLSTAALVGAAVGISLVIVQRFVKVDLVGGLALFGVAMLLVSAGLALVFQDDMAVKMRTSIVGVISALLFLGDGLFGGNRLGRGLARYLPYTDTDPARLAVGMGVLGLTMAALNYGVATVASTDVWLFYTTFVDFFLVMLLVILVFRYARGQMFAPRTD